MPSFFWETLRIFLETPPGIVIGSLIALLLVETLVRVTWNSWYFTKGLPILVLRVSIVPQQNNIPSPIQLDANFKSVWVSSLVFREIEPNAYGFREELGIQFFRYPPVMHGMLFSDRNNNQVVVKGLMSWFSICISLVLLGYLIQNPEPIIILTTLFLFVLLIGIPYWIQYYRFSKVIEYAAQMWTRECL